jgi:hypothetical protein
MTTNTTTPTIAKERQFVSLLKRVKQNDRTEVLALLTHASGYRQPLTKMRTAAEGRAYAASSLADFDKRQAII